MNSLVNKFVSAWLHPWATMESVRMEGSEVSIKPAMIFIVAMGLLSGLITALIGMIIPPPNVVAGVSPKAVVWLSVLIIPLISLVGSFVGAFVLWGIIYGLLKGALSEYKISYRILAVLAAFSPLSAALSPIPGNVGPFTVGQILAFAVNIWATIVMIKGIIIVSQTSTVRTWVICGVIFGLLFLIGIAARNAAESNFGANPTFSGLGADDELGDITPEDEDALNKELEGLAEKERNAPKAVEKK